MSAETGQSVLNLKVLTPEGAVLEGEVSEVTLPGSEGEMGVLPLHAACLSRLSPGKLSYRSTEGDDSVAVGKGVAEIQNNQVTVIVDMAVLREDIDVTALETRRRKITSDLEKGDLDKEKYRFLEEELMLTDVQLRVGREDQ